MIRPVSLKEKKLSDVLEYVKNELQKIAVWFRSNKMAVNTSKTKFIVFRTHGKKINPEECVLTFNNKESGQPVDPRLIYNIDRIYNEGQEKNFKLLGILFNEYLSFDAHVSSLCVKISKSLSSDRQSLFWSEISYNKPPPLCLR